MKLGIDETIKDLKEEFFFTTFPNLTIEISFNFGPRVDVLTEVHLRANTSEITNNGSPLINVIDFIAADLKERD